MDSASEISKTRFLSFDPVELCDRLKLLLQEKHGGNNTDIINQEIIATVDDLLEYKCISKKQHKKILIRCILLHKYYIYTFFYIKMLKLNKNYEVDRKIQ